MSMGQEAPMAKAVTLNGVTPVPYRLSISMINLKLENSLIEDLKENLVKAYSPLLKNKRSIARKLSQALKILNQNKTKCSSLGKKDKTKRKSHRSKKIARVTRLVLSESLDN
jgi:hypothetical protein